MKRSRPRSEPALSQYLGTGINHPVYVSIRRNASITWLSLRDLLETRGQKLVVYSVYIPPLFPPLIPTCHDHGPYLVLQPWDVHWANWPVASHNVEDDDTISIVPVR